MMPYHRKKPPMVLFQHFNRNYQYTDRLSKKLQKENKFRGGMSRAGALYGKRFLGDRGKRMVPFIPFSSLALPVEKCNLRATL